MNILNSSYYIKAWLRNLISIKAGSALLSSFGVLWLFIEVGVYFFANTQFSSTLHQSWLLFLISGIFIATVICRPRIRVSCKLNGRDVSIEIAIGNIFDFPGALIIGSNTTFDTQISKKLISDKSIQGQFTKRYYGDETQLDSELQASLASIDHEVLTVNHAGKNLKYPIGTVVRLNPTNRTAYFVAIAHINEHGVAEGTYEQLKVALGNLWVFIGTKGIKESLVVPVLGTGFSRITKPREEVIREIVNSFKAACAEKIFCDKLTIVISPKDIQHYQISLERLGAFIQHICTYTEFSMGDRPKQGQAVE